MRGTMYYSTIKEWTHQIFRTLNKEQKYDL